MVTFLVLNKGFDGGELDLASPADVNIVVAVLGLILEAAEVAQVLRVQRKLEAGARCCWFSKKKLLKVWCENLCYI